MIDLGGELLVVRRRAAARDADVARLLDVAKHWEAEWRLVERTTRRTSRRNSNGDSASPAAGSPPVSSTDVLEHTGENLQRLTRQLDGLTASLRADRKALDQVAEPLEAEVLRSRMMPFAEACEGLERAVRDVAQGAGKDVDLNIEGGEIEIDRSVLEDIKNPLLHLVRNAVDHGIESSAARVAAGKPLRGTITISAALRNGRVEIVVADDGRGLDLEAIRQQARKRDLTVPADDQEVARLVFAPGFSTASIITTLSGRGVGLDVVKTGVEARRGRVDVAFEVGRGTRFVIVVPLTLTRLRTLLVRAGGQIYAFDSADVRNLLRVGTDRLRMMEGRDVLTFDGSPVPVFPLTEILGQPTHEVPRVAGKVPVVVLGTASERAAFSVDELLAEQEVVIKDLGPRLRGVRNVVGATILATGRIALILDAADLMAKALGNAPSQALSVALAEQPTEAKKRLLVVDDSVTTRTLVKTILDAEGYSVTAAADGMEAWQILQEKGADLVVSDVEMPRMDGFALTEAIRGSARLRDLPVILMTALETEKDRLHGMEAGATAYLLKSAFDQTNLVQAIRQIL
jgi:two-component system chemotaxis sensor kinase CheA